MAHLVLYFGGGHVHAGLEGDVDLGYATFHFVHYRNDGGFGHIAAGEAGRLQFLGAQAVAGDVDHVIDAPEDADVAVGGLHGAVAGVVRPVAPVFAPGIAVVLGVVLPDEALAVAPDGLENSRPRITDTDVARLARAGRNLPAFFVEDDRVNAR